MPSGATTARDEVNRPKLLFFAADLDHQTDLEALCLYLDHLRQCGRFDITVMGTNRSPFSDHVRTLGIPLHPISDFSLKLLQRTPQLWPILTATRRYRFDVAVCHRSFALRGLKQICRHVVGVCHDDDFDGYNASDRVVALTSGAAELAQDTLEDVSQITVLPYPHTCRFEAISNLPDEGSPLTVGTVGPFVEGDGLGMFIHAAQLAHQANPSTRFVVAGNGPMEHELKELADQIAPFIDFVGPLDYQEMAEQFDLFCLSAPVAPYSTQLCAMMDAGVACLSTCTHGPMDILKGGMVAPLVPVGDAFLLAVQLQELLEDRARIARIQKACFERIREEDFAPEEFQARLIALLESH